MKLKKTPLMAKLLIVVILAALTWKYADLRTDVAAKTSEVAALNQDLSMAGRRISGCRTALPTWTPTRVWRKSPDPNWAWPSPEKSPIGIPANNPPRLSRGTGHINKGDNT